MTTFTYQLTPDQYRRFQHPSNTREIQILGKPLGVLVADGPEHDSWIMSGTIEGGAWIASETWYQGITTYVLRVVIRKRPWWAFDFLLNAAFKAALK